jgi:hypothetical protein
MKGCVQRRKTAMPPACAPSWGACAQGIAENRGTASGNLYCQKGCPPARAWGIAL